MKNEPFSDDWLRDHADSTDGRPAPDGWDTPSEQVWMRVRTGLQRRKRRRRFVFWGLACAIFTLGCLAFWQTGKPAAPPAAGPGPRTAPVAPAATTAPRPPANGPESLEKSAAAPFFLSKKPTAGAEKSLPFPVQKNNAASLVARPAAAETSPAPNPLAAGTAVNLNSGFAVETPAWSTLPLRRHFVQSILSDSVRSSLHTALSDLPAGKRKSRAFFQIGLTGGLFFTTRTLRGDPGGRPNGRESGAWTSQCGLTASRALGRHWRLETGLQWTAVRLRAERRGVVRFRSDQERYDPNRDVYETSTRQEVQTSFGSVDMRVDIGRQAGQIIHNQEAIRLSLQTDERVNYLRLPLTLRFADGSGRWQWSAQTGLGLNLRSGYDLTVTAARADRMAIRTVSARAERRAAGLAPALIDAQIGLRLAYRFAPRWSVAAAPEFRHGLGSMTRQPAFRAYPVSVGLQLGAYWQLP